MSDSFDAEEFDQFLSKGCAKPGYVIVIHPYWLHFVFVMVTEFLLFDWMGGTSFGL